MRSGQFLLLVPALAGLPVLVGCDAILGIGDHTLGAAPGGDGSSTLGTTSQSTSSSTSSSQPADGGGAVGNEGGSVTPLYCSGDASLCVVGAIESVGRVPGDAGVMADGGIVTLTDDGFEQGGTSCNSTGTTCVTGGISP